MESIRQIGMLLCIISMISMLVFYLLPKTGLAATVRSCAGVFCVTAIAVAVWQGDYHFKLDFSKLQYTREYAVEREAVSQTVNLTENAVSDVIYGALKKEGFEVESVSVSLHISSDNSISISRIRVSATADAPQITAYILKEYGIESDVQLSKAG